MEGNVYNPQGLTALNKRKNTQHWKNLNPALFIHQPSDEVVTRMFDLIVKLNGAIKYPDFCISKSSFYNVKARAILWLILQHNSGLRDFNYTIDKIQAAPVSGGKDLVAMTLTVGDRKWEFHQPLESPLRWVLWDSIYMQPIGSFEATEHIPMGTTGVLDAWEELLTLLAENDFFILDELDPRGWWDVIRLRYPGTFNTVGVTHGAWKLSTMLGGGPKIAIQKTGHEVRLGVLRTHFTEIMAANNTLLDFTLSPKKILKIIGPNTK